MRINGVVNFVFQCGKPAIIRDEEMERMWTFLEKHDTDKLEVVNLEPGEKVKVDGGPMSGNKGSVVHADGKKVTILIESLNMQIRAEIATKDVEKIEKH